MSDLWVISEDSFDPHKQHHKDTIFTIGNGYLCTRGALEEGYPNDHRATFIHGVFDEAPIVFTELANAPDWLPIQIYLNGERFSLDSGTIDSFSRSLDLRSGVLSRLVRWHSPSGLTATLAFERFASLADEHLLYVRCRVIPEFAGTVEFRAGLNGNMHNEGLVHFDWTGQGARDEILYLQNRTRRSGIEVAAAMRITSIAESKIMSEDWDVQNVPTRMVRFEAVPGQEVGIEKGVAFFTTRDQMSGRILDSAVNQVQDAPSWNEALTLNKEAWAEEWNRTDVILEGDQEAQIAIRFNLF